jgi:signal transduction histidine kinase
MRLRPGSATLITRLPRRTVRLRLTALYGGLFLASGAGLLAIVITSVLARGWPPPPDTSVGIAKGTNAAQAHQIRARAAAQAAHAAHQHSAAVQQLLASSAIALAVMTLVSVALGWVVAGRVLRPLRAMTAATRHISEDNLAERLALAGPADELKDLADTIDGLLARLQAAFDAQRQFVANASHELRTPLTLTRTLLQTVLTDPHPTVTSFRDTCEEVLEAGTQQERMIEALLTLARSQRGLDHRDLVDLAVITSDVLNACQPDAAQRGICISADVSTAPVLGDQRLLQRMVANLIDNAVRHNINGGRIHLHVTGSGSQAALSIANTGPVVPAGQIARLLQPFQRLATGRQCAGDGAGLGLSIATAIAEAHNATLTVTPGPCGGLDIQVGFPSAATAPLGRPAGVGPAPRRGLQDRDGRHNGLHADIDTVTSARRR